MTITEIIDKIKAYNREMGLYVEDYINYCKAVGRNLDDFEKGELRGILQMLQVLNIITIGEKRALKLYAYEWKEKTV